MSSGSVLPLESHTRSMRILFIPCYYYLQYPIFKPIIHNLKKLGHDPVLLHIEKLMDLEECRHYTEEKLSADGIPHITLSFLLKKHSGRFGFGQYANRLIYFLLNRSRIIRSIERLKPDVVVIGSHLGTTHIRIVQVHCAKHQIPVVSIWATADYLNEKYGCMMRILASILGIRELLEWSHYNKFMHGHVFLASNNTIKRHMISLGIPGSQIKVTGMPNYGDILDVSKSTREDIHSDVVNALGLPYNSRYVVFLTEVVQEVWGEGIVSVISEGFSNCARRLPQDVALVVRFHPRESQAVKDLIRSSLRDVNCAIDPGLPLAKLCYGAIAVAGHFSSALNTAVFFGIPAFGVNLNGDPKHSFYRDPEMSYFEPASFEELSGNLERLCSDKSRFDSASRQIFEWGRSNLGGLDSSSAERISQEILRTGYRGRNV